jgi:hypothetical protein
MKSVLWKGLRSTLASGHLSILAHVTSLDAVKHGPSLITSVLQTPYSPTSPVVCQVHKTVHNFVFVWLTAEQLELKVAALVVSQLKLSVTGSPTRRPSFISRALLVGARVDIISLWQVFLHNHLLLLSVVIPRMLHVRLSVNWNVKMDPLDSAFPLTYSLTPPTDHE